MPGAVQRPCVTAFATAVCNGRVQPPQVRNVKSEDLVRFMLVFGIFGTIWMLVFVKAGATAV